MPADSVFAEGSLSGSQMTALLLCPHMVQGVKKIRGGLFHDGTKPVHEGSTLRSQASPKGPHLLIPSHQALRFQYMSLGEGHSDCSTPISLCFPQCSLLCFPLHPDNLNPSRKPLANTCSLSVRWLELRRFCSKATKTGQWCEAQGRGCRNRKKHYLGNCLIHLKFSLQDFWSIYRKSIHRKTICQNPNPYNLFLKS